MGHTVNSPYCEHSRDHDLVSSVDGDSVITGDCFSQTSVENLNGELAAVRSSGVSAIARCPQGES